MSRVNVQTVNDGQERTASVFAVTDQLSDRIRQRAFEIYTERGCHHGHALEDWLAAESELCWPAVELSEDDGCCEVEVALPGYEPKEIAVTATPHEIIVHAWKKARGGAKGRREPAVVRWSGFRDNDVYRRIDLGADIDVNSVVAELRNGLLRIVATKLQRGIASPPMAAAG